MEEISVIDRRGLTITQEDDAWELYEKIGSMSAVANQMSLPMHRIRYALLKDPLRLSHIRACRAESIAQAWEEKGEQSARIAGRVLDVMDGMLRHIEACAKAGSVTDLKSNGRNLTVTEAYQWVLGIRSLDMVQKVGMTAAKVAEGLRSLHSHDHYKQQQSLNPSQMTDDELRDVVQSLQEAGRPVPWGLAQWFANKSQKSLLTRAEIVAES